MTFTAEQSIIIAKTIMTTKNEILMLGDKYRSFNNQLQLLKDKFIDSNILFEQGHQFTINSSLLALCQNMLGLQRTQDVLLLDDYQNPVLIADLKHFTDEAWQLYQGNLNRYHVEYQSLLKNKGEVISPRTVSSNE